MIIYSSVRESFTSLFYLISSHKVLEQSAGLEYPDGIKWELALCNLAVWAIVFFVLCKGIKSLGKVSYMRTSLYALSLTMLLTKPFNHILHHVLNQILHHIQNIILNHVLHLNFITSFSISITAH